MTHPAFLRASQLENPNLRAHFPKSAAEAIAFVPRIRVYALSARVLAVAVTRVECAWTAYCDAVPGYNHRNEEVFVRERGAKLEEGIARAIFPEFDGVPYAD